MNEIKLRLLDENKAKLFGLPAEDLTVGGAEAIISKSHPNWNLDEVMYALNSAIAAGAFEEVIQTSIADKELEA